jgi:DNA-binding NtrC family response regulator
MHGSILIIDDEKSLADTYARMLEHKGYTVDAAYSAEDARAKMQRLYPDVVFVDLHLPDARGDQLLAELKRVQPEAHFIILTAYGSIRSAVECTHKGASDYLTKPIEFEELLFVVQRNLEGCALQAEVQRLRSCTSHLPRQALDADPLSRYPSTAMRKTLEVAEKAARQNGIVLLLGESGAGKDHLARFIHQRSPRAKGPFFTINCAALPRDLAESELFGHEPGAFTGTKGRKRGLVELAQGGTLLLNEIGELDPLVQVKLLTFLDSASFMRVGGERQIEVDTRILAATNRDLAQDARDGSFRWDLYYRINVFPIRVPSLRERTEELPLLIDELLDALVEKMGLAKKPGLAAGVLEKLTAYQWPGNIRELRNLLERAIILSEGGTIRPHHFSFPGDEREWKLEVGFPAEQQRNLHQVTREVARCLVREALKRSGGRKQNAARLLGISRHALAYQIKNLDIQE